MRGSRQPLLLDSMPPMSCAGRIVGRCSATATDVALAEVSCETRCGDSAAASFQPFPQHVQYFLAPSCSLCAVRWTCEHSTHVQIHPVQRKYFEDCKKELRTNYASVGIQVISQMSVETKPIPTEALERKSFVAGDSFHLSQAGRTKRSPKNKLRTTDRAGE